MKYRTSYWTTRMIALIVIFFLRISSAIACVCGTWGAITIRDYNENDVIFLGRVLKVQDSSKYKITTFLLLHNYKNGANDTIKVFAPGDPNDCGFNRIDTGQVFLVYANQHRLSGFTFTSRCTRTSRSFSSDTAFLNQAQKKMGHAGNIEFKDDSDFVNGRGMFVDNHPEGQWKYYKGNALWEEGRYENGLREGTWTEYFENGKPKYVNVFHHGVPTLEYIMYGEYDYRKSYESHPFGNGSAWVDKIYHSNGKLRVVMMRDPPIKRSGSEYFQDQGLLNGLCIVYYENGVIKEKGNHYKGFEVGKWRYYNSKGRLIKSEMKKSKKEIDGRH